MRARRRRRRWERRQLERRQRDPYGILGGDGDGCRVHGSWRRHSIIIDGYGDGCGDGGSNGGSDGGATAGATAATGAAAAATARAATARPAAGAATAAGGMAMRRRTRHPGKSRPPTKNGCGADQKGRGANQKRSASLKFGVTPRKIDPGKPGKPGFKPRNRPQVV